MFTSMMARPRIEGPSEPELEALRLSAEGLTAAEIAARTFRSPHAIKTRMESVRRKLGARNVTHAVVQAVRQGLI